MATVMAEDRFGRRVRQEREKRGWTQADLAERMAERGVVLHVSAIAKLEARDVDAPRSIRLNEAWAAADALGIRIDDLLDLAESQVVLAGRKLMAGLEAFDSARRRLHEGVDAMHDLVVGDRIIDVKRPSSHRDLEDLRSQMSQWLKRLDSLDDNPSAGPREPRGRGSSSGSGTSS